MCMGGGGGSGPSVKPAPPPPILTAPIEADTGAANAADQERKRRQAASGRSDTILTSGMGVAGQAATGGKKLLGE